MQIYALDANGKVVAARNAMRSSDYLCLECGSLMRLRGGYMRQLHFFHPKPNQFCRQQGKSQVHILIQNHFKKKLFPEEIWIEHPFPEIRRIADVVWPSKKIIFEIQCSPISGKEVLERNADYLSLGYKVVWILHERTFNRSRLSHAEKCLQSSPHYFTRMSLIGKESIYDQYALTKFGKRLKKMPPLPIDIRKISFTLEKFPPSFPHERKKWGLSFKGDLYDRGINFLKRRKRKKLYPWNIFKTLRVYFLEKLSN